MPNGPAGCDHFHAAFFAAEFCRVRPRRACVAHGGSDAIDEIEIGYRIHPTYWNRGIATEAARAVPDYGFDMLRLERVISLIHPDNHASRRVTEKNGMILEKQTTFRGFPTLVFALDRTSR